MLKTMSSYIVVDGAYISWFVAVVSFMVRFMSAVAAGQRPADGCKYTTFLDFPNTYGPSFRLVCAF